MRAFLAVYPDETSRSAIADVVPDATDAVRPTDMADWHVTIRFLGELDDDDEPLVRARLSERLSVAPACTLRLGPYTAIGTSAKVLFVPVEGAEPLADLVDAALDGLVAPREQPFRGHVTIARSRGRARLPRSLAGCPVSERFVASEVALVASRLEPERAVHHVVDRFPLAGESA